MRRETIAEMQYTVRAFVRGKAERLDGVCRVFPSMERTAYNLLRDGESAAGTKRILRETHGIKNARWLQSAINQAGAVIGSQEEEIRFRIELYEEKIRNTAEKVKNLRSLLKAYGCEAKIERLRKRVVELKEKVTGHIPGRYSAQGASSGSSAWLKGRGARS
jgi:hypothetical protein